ncbi:ABC transporter ATP-binding protein [Agreia sp.]|uniref:ABC transporter ATP-binding protein n=1 Tax=Agreia sp. TaxID=1872416 RepID=UPI0035BBAF66
MTTTRLAADRVRLAYGAKTVSENLTVGIPDGSFTVIVGANACGKSTLLRALARLLVPSEGTIVLDGRDITAVPTREVAQMIGLLPQISVAPDGITVADLVAHGRYPHQRMLKQWSVADASAVNEALELTDTTVLADRFVDELSGGQRQRAWIAMALAQQTPYLLLDEPTTYLDIAHQIDVLELCADLNRRGRTLVAVLHDLNHAARYATHLIAMKDGAVVAEGDPRSVVSTGFVRDVFGLNSTILTDPYSQTPLVVPAGRSRD